MAPAQLYDHTKLRQRCTVLEICAFLKTALLKLRVEIAQKAVTIEVPKIIGDVSDGEASVRGALTILCEDSKIGTVLNCRCIAHLCNLVPTSIFEKSLWFRQMVLYTTRIVSYVRYSNRASRELKAAGAKRVYRDIVILDGVRYMTVWHVLKNTRSIS